jgi:putative component of membrane protein insertase Oxa1/YidC/SpoIIIJ protein YidD/TM2 domain-containing membrane protein YozV
MTHQNDIPRHSDRRYWWPVLVLMLTGAYHCALASSDSSAAATEQYGTGTSTMLTIYQRYVSPLKGGNTCPMYPACSQYSKCAFERSNPAAAFMATCDRLVRCGRDASAYPMIAAGGGFKRYDPPDDAVFSPAAAPVGQSGDRDSGCASFARTLFAERNYPLALLEFERTAHSSAGRPCRMAALLGLLDCAYRTCSLDGFLETFYRVTDSMSGDTGAVSRCGILLAKRYYSADDYGGALSALGHYVRSSDPSLRAERLFLATLCQLARRHPERALASADSIPPESGLGAIADSLHKGADRFYSHERSPMLAGVLSAVLPGTGYLYAGKPATASASLLVNGLFIWTAVDFINNRHYGAAAASFVLGSGFYFGNIRGSIKAVRQNTRSARKRRCAFFIDELHYAW